MSYAKKWQPSLGRVIIINIKDGYLYIRLQTLKKCCLFLFVLPFFSQADAEIGVGFSPGGTAQALILSFIHTAADSADVAAYDFTSVPIAESLSQLAQSGIPVRIIADEKKSHDRWSLVNKLACSGIQVRTDAQYSIMHNKFIVTGNNDVQTGSFNYTSSAEKRNAENALVIKDNSFLSKQYQNEFNRLWAESSPVQCNNP